jgi:hypothetical protein
MAQNSIIVAGERLQDLEAALDLFTLEIEECGCLVMTAVLPRHLSQCLDRALKTIAAQMAAGLDPDVFEGGHIDPMKELFRRIGDIESGQNESLP